MRFPWTRLPAVVGPVGSTTRVPGIWTQHTHTGRHAGRSYDVYTPAGIATAGSTRTAAPLLVLLHGCQQTAADFARASGFAAAADETGFVLVAPRQEMRHQLQRCWRWYDTAHQRRDSGEPALLADIVAEVLADPTRRIDDRRVYVAGLSAGGAMALILATTYPDVFAAAGVHSATAYRSATQGFGALTAMSARSAAPSHRGVGEMAPVVLIHGTDDRVVRPPNADRIVDQWLTSRDSGRDGTPLSRIRPLASTRALMVGGRRCIRTRWYTAGGRRVLEYWRIDGLGHAWSGGRTKGSYIDRTGPVAATVMWNFFQRHRISSRRVVLAPLQLHFADDFAARAAHLQFE